MRPSNIMSGLTSSACQQTADVSLYSRLFQALNHPCMSTGRKNVLLLTYSNYIYLSPCLLLRVYSCFTAMSENLIKAVQLNTNYMSTMYEITLVYFLPYVQELNLKRTFLPLENFGQCY